MRNDAAWMSRRRPGPGVRVTPASQGGALVWDTVTPPPDQDGHVQAVTLQRARRQVWPMCGVSSRDRSGPQRRMVRCWDSRQPLLGWVLSAQNSPHHRAAAVHRRCALIARGLGYGGIDIGFISPPAEPAGGGPSASAGRLDPTALRSLAHDRDLVVLAWGNAIDVHCGAAAARLLQQELARHCGSLAVLGWTTDGRPLDVDGASRAPTLSCLCCAPTGSYDHDARFDRLVMGAVS
ncbi:hypothetical protein MCHLDSM_01277 [Mycolicibacterium chlorophenolicum]|uniref:DUF1643 domain-containing protein n=1 Tax=Mycolicibacterium chlorophenolicum TaxID=37916 RepID=A0A0J6WJ90_9MYCO|nr:hypothetical protein MCHLDSM_01277 [Mycolicibacterium chlorophenolicum]